MNRAPSPTARGFDFGVVLWGPEFRGYFLDYCLASLLAPGNIPALDEKADSRFLVCTTAADWEAMREHANFQLLESMIPAVHVPMDAPAAELSTMRAMSRGHKAIADAMHGEGRRGMFVYPDTVFSDGLVAEVQRLASRGSVCVLAHCPRFANEGFLVDLASAGLVEPGRPIAMDGGELLQRGARHMHSETLRYDWNSPYFFAMSPALVYWRLPGGGFLFHTLTWAPVLIDYGRIGRHDTTALEDWTIDGDYVFRNVPGPGAVHALFDRPDLALISFTPESRFTYLPLALPPDQSFARKVVWLNRYLRRSGTVDPLKLALFRRPLLVGADERDWRVRLTRLRAAVIVTLALAEPRMLLPLRTWLALRQAVATGWDRLKPWGRLLLTAHRRWGPNLAYLAAVTSRPAKAAVTDPARRTVR